MSTVKRSLAAALLVAAPAVGLAQERPAPPLPVVEIKGNEITLRLPSLETLPRPLLPPLPAFGSDGPVLPPTLKLSVPGGPILRPGLTLPDGLKHSCKVEWTHAQSSFALSRTNDQFVVSHREGGGLTWTVRGRVVEGKALAQGIERLRATKKEVYERVQDLPEADRPLIQRMLDVVTAEPTLELPD